MALSRDAILAAPVAKTEVFVPEWNDTVFIRALSMRARIKLLDVIEANNAAHEAWKEDQAKPEDERAGVERVDIHNQPILTLIFAICDDKGEQLFTIEDYAHFESLDYSTMVALYGAFKAFENRDALASPEEVKKNSVATRKGASSSASRKVSVRR